MAIFTRGREEADQLRTAPWPGDNGQGEPGGFARASGILRGRRWWWSLVALALVAGTVVGVEAASGPTTYALTADFARAPGLFPGASVEVLGVPVGTVTSVRDVGDEVRVGLAVSRGHPVPANAVASLVSPEILGEPSIDLSPGYTSGRTLRPGAVIPLSRTSVPVSTEQVLKDLRTTLERVNPHAVGALVTNLANDLQGQGKSLNALISGAAGTLKLLATKADDLGQLNGALAQLTGQLDSRTAQITQLITDYDTVSGVVAQRSSQLGGAVVQLSQASADLVQLLAPNLAPIEGDVRQLTTVGRTLDRNLTSIDEVFSASTALFTGARRVYTPSYNWLTLNSQLPTGLTGALLADMVGSRLEGVCRRILAHHATGLTTAQKKTLETCGNPASNFFGPVISEVGTVLNDVRSGTLPVAQSPAQMFKKGLQKIPGVGSAPKTSPPTTSPGASSGGASAPSGGPGGTSPTSGTGSGAATGGTSHTCLGVLGGVLTCSPGTGTKTNTSSTPASSGTGLLSYRVPARGHHASSLRAAATSTLPPLPATAPGAQRHRRSARHRPRAGRPKGHR